MSDDLKKACVDLFRRLHGMEPTEVDVIDDDHGARVHLRTDDGGQVHHAIVLVSRWSKQTV